MLQFKGLRSSDFLTGKGYVMNRKHINQLPLVSVGLAVINVLVYLTNIVTGQSLFLAGALSLGTVMRGEWGRILWATFLHAGTGHLFNNMILLIFMGAMIEKEVGHLFLLLAYLTAGIGGNLVSLAWKWLSGRDVFSIGASGAIFGLDGILLALILFYGKRWEGVSLARVVFMIGYSLYSGFSAANIDNGAHVGGLATGFLLGGIWCLWKKSVEGAEKKQYEY